ncbi:betaketoacyl synthase domain-containing protein [Colletotrichum higginsianum]|nr:betaketoacyl synthase domain-containing protein [Colletotrichum higginsianum]
MAISSPPNKPPLTLFLFGDQTYTVPKRDLQLLLDDEAFRSTSPTLSSPLCLFTRRCETALQRDLAQILDPAEADHLWPSGTLVLADLLSQWRLRSDGSSSSSPHHRRCLPLDMALLAAYQILMFMRHVGSSPFSPPSTRAYADGDATVVGACTGALAGAAVACSIGLAELVPLGVEAVRVAFRVGLVVERSAREAAPGTGTEQPWSVAVSAAEERTLQGVRAFLERFVGENKDKTNNSNRSSSSNGWRQTNGGRDNTKKEKRGLPCWVSAWAPSSVTVSGPPEELAELAESDGLAVPGVRMVPMPIFGPFHSPSVHTEEDVAGVLAPLYMNPGLASTPACLKVMSASTGKPPPHRDEAGDFGSLTRAAVEDMLLRPLRWDLVLQKLCEHVETDEHGTAQLEVVPIASSAEPSIDAALARAQKGTRRRGPMTGRPRTLKRQGVESTTIHRVVAETDLMVGDGLYLVTEADLARPDLKEAVQGHMVEGKPLCTPSIYADIAMTLGNYLVKKLRSDGNKHGKAHDDKHDMQDCLVTVSDLGVSKALVAGDNGPGSQLLQCHAQADWSSRSARCKFTVVGGSSGKPQQHAECTIRITDTSTRALLAQHASGESHRINVSSLRARAGTTQISGSMAYRLVSPLADFHRNHRLVQSLVLDPRTHEIAALVSFPAGLAGVGDFTAHPAVIDAFTQPAGFCLNLDDATDLAHTVYINHGWDDMLLFEPVDMEHVYTVYVRMQQVGRTRKWAGDIIVLREEDDTVVAAFLQYSVNAFPRRVFSSLLGQETRTTRMKTGATAAAAAVSAMPPPWSPLQTPKPRMTLSIDTKGGVFPPSPVSPEDPGSKGPPSASSSSAALRTNIAAGVDGADGDDEHDTEDTQDTPDTLDAFDGPLTTIPIPPCKSVVLQGFPKTARTLLFLLPDGAGTAASYASLPPVGRDVCVIGLDCPFLRGDTDAMARVPLDRLLAEGYLPEILRRQPPSPSSSSSSSHKGYVLGGWSAGGSLAFRAAQMLAERGCRVAGLVLIDAPVPLNGMDRLPRHFYEYCQRLGIFGGWEGGRGMVVTSAAKHRPG